jgi:Lanthionine synthetase C-like protein
MEKKSSARLTRVFFGSSLHISLPEAGILAVLLQVPKQLVSPDDLSAIRSSTLTLLSLVGTTWNGHLPSSLPASKDRASATSGDLVQICHGAPGALILIAAVRSCHPEIVVAHTRTGSVETASVLERAERTASDKVWAEGLLKKGIGVCHGVTGNAWPLLLASESSGQQQRQQDTCLELSRALAFLVHSVDLPPLELHGPSPAPYQEPDVPYSLFEGLAGAVCAWVDACAAIQGRLDPRPEHPSSQVFRLPGLGGLGPKPVF